MAVGTPLAALDSPGAFVSAEEFEGWYLAEERDGLHCELLDGIVHLKMGQSRIHSDALSLVFRAFNNLPLHLATLSQSTVRFNDRNVPEPDFALAERDPATATRPLSASDLRLVVEIAVSSLRTDRKIKGRIYAEAGVPEYWIINPRDRQIEVYRDPHEGEYRLLRVAVPGEEISPEADPERTVPVASLMPAPDED